MPPIKDHINRAVSLLKPIERANRTFWHWLLDKVWHNMPLERPLDPRSIRRVLFLRYDAIGDMLTTLPTIALLKRLNPAMEIDVMASERNRSVIEHDPNISRILPLRDRPDLFIQDIRTARANGYDVIFCCIFAKATKIGIIANMIGGDRAVKTTVWRGEKYGRFFNVQSKSAQSAPSMWDKMINILPDTFDHELRPEDIRPYVAIDESSRRAAREGVKSIGMEGRKYIAVNLTSVRDRNRWTSGGYIALIAAALDHDPTLGVILLWMGAADRALAGEIAEATELQERFRGRIGVYPPTRNVLEIVAVVEGSHAVFSPDTGVVHMASATRRPVMSLHVAGTRSITEWRPYGVPYRALQSAFSNQPVSEIPAGRVIAEFIALLEQIVGKGT